MRLSPLSRTSHHAFPAFEVCLAGIFSWIYQLPMKSFGYIILATKTSNNLWLQNFGSSTNEKFRLQNITSKRKSCLPDLGSCLLRSACFSLPTSFTAPRENRARQIRTSYSGDLGKFKRLVLWDILIWYPAISVFVICFSSLPRYSYSFASKTFFLSRGLGKIGWSCSTRHGVVIAKILNGHSNLWGYVLCSCTMVHHINCPGICPHQVAAKGWGSLGAIDCTANQNECGKHGIEGKEKAYLALVCSIDEYTLVNLGAGICSLSRNSWHSLLIKRMCAKNFNACLPPLTFFFGYIFPPFDAYFKCIFTIAMCVWSMAQGYPTVILFPRDRRPVKKYEGPRQVDHMKANANNCK